MLATKFIDQIYDQLKLQSNTHPDPIVRNFYSATQIIIKQKAYIKMISELFNFRPTLSETHFVNLWLRSIQYYFRKNSNVEYLNYSVMDWIRYFETRGKKDNSAILEILKTHNTATLIPARYRSLHTALRLISQTNPHFHINLLDLGCSLGLGLKSCLADNLLSHPPFEDNTPDQQIRRTISRKLINPIEAIGLDIHIPSIEWVKACNYPSKYDNDGKVLDELSTTLSTRNDVFLIQADAKDPEVYQRLVSAYGPMTIVHASMTLYELTPKEKRIVINNICQSLSEGGVFIEFTFIDPLDWFRGIHTLVRVKRHNKLTKAYVWHRWKDSRCSSVIAGKDYDKVNQILQLIGITNEKNTSLSVPRTVKST